MRRPRGLGRLGVGEAERRPEAVDPTVEQRPTAARVEAVVGRAVEGERERGLMGDERPEVALRGRARAGAASVGGAAT